MSLDTSISNQINSLTDNEKQIYNTFNAVRRSIKNQPYKNRTNFDNLDPEHFVLLKKIGYLLKKYPNINYFDFFNAPYKVYSEADYYDLNFYNTRKAIICYSRYMSLREIDSPDSQHIIDNCKDALKFIIKFCIQNNIKINNYIKYTAPNNSVPVWLLHLKDHKINFYILHSLNIDNAVKNIESDLLNFIIPNFFELLSKSRTKFITSTILKLKLKKCLEGINI